MKTIHRIIKFLTNNKERWNQEEDIKITLKDVKSVLSHKASNWITFQDDSGEIKIYEIENVLQSIETTVKDLEEGILYDEEYDDEEYDDEESSS